MPVKQVHVLEYQFAAAPKTQDKLQIGGVEVSVRADVIVYGLNRRSELYGAGMYRLTHEFVRILALSKMLPKVRFHVLRHTHATHLLTNGVHPKIAQERLGHSTIGITLDLYGHVMPGMQADAAAKVDAAIRAAQKGKPETIG